MSSKTINMIKKIRTLSQGIKNLNASTLPEATV